ncbi:conserved hypothetical protein [Burkholderiales bacterium 8X]|nr:conserved hypothetical protein [Burkholderiales bacterium 8X]
MDDDRMMPQAPARAGHVFVYGTLRRGGSNDINRYEPAPTFVGTAAISGRMFHLGAYPGVRLVGTGLVVGEVYRIDAELERQLDLLEGIEEDGSGEYVKRWLDVEVKTVAAAITQRCLVYEIDPAHIADRAEIESGDWLLGI